VYNLHPYISAFQSVFSDSLNRLQQEPLFVYDNGLSTYLPTYQPENSSIRPAWRGLEDSVGLEKYKTPICVETRCGRSFHYVNSDCFCVHNM